MKATWHKLCESEKCELCCIFLRHGGSKLGRKTDNQKGNEPCTATVATAGSKDDDDNEKQARA